MSGVGGIPGYLTIKPSSPSNPPTADWKKIVFGPVVNQNVTPAYHDYLFRRFIEDNRVSELMKCYVDSLVLVEENYEGDVACSEDVFFKTYGTKDSGVLQYPEKLGPFSIFDVNGRKVFVHAVKTAPGWRAMKKKIIIATGFSRFAKSDLVAKGFVRNALEASYCIGGEILYTIIDSNENTEELLSNV
jgi:hypothetical protein